jgi:hypothetical protein
MLQNWLYAVPKDPLRDLDEVIHREGQKDIINGVDTMTHMYHNWSPIQLALSWKNDVFMKETIDRLLHMGADINAPSRKGINGLHLLILFMFFRRQPLQDIHLLEWLLTRGANVNVPAILYDIQLRDYVSYSPLSLFIALNKGECKVSSRSYMPPNTSYGKHRAKIIAHKHVQRCLLLLLCYGARSNVMCDELEEILNLSVVNTPPYPFLTDYLTVQYKLPADLDQGEVQKRVQFLHRFAPHIHHEDIIDCRRQIFYKKKTTSHYYNTQFEDNAEFMPYEFLSYTDSHGHVQNFHKTLFTTLVAQKVNPFTKDPIPPHVLQSWCQEMSERPLCFHQVFTLKETCSTNILKIFHKIDHMTETNKKNDDVLQLCHLLLSACFPYTNLMSVQGLDEDELKYLCHALADEPYALEIFTFSGNRGETVLNFFCRSILSYIQDPLSTCELLHFGIEDILQDISCFHAIIRVFGNQTFVFKKNFLDIIVQEPMVGDILRDRIGYVHLPLFLEIWKRMCTIENFLKKKKY